MNSTNPKNFEGLSSPADDAMRTAAANPMQTVYYPAIRAKSADVQEFFLDLMRRAKSMQAGSVVYIQMPKSQILRVEVKEIVG